MTDHLEQAAERALEIAAQIRDPDTSETRVIAANDALAHLTYLAGLIRGGAVTPPIETLHLGKVTFGGKTELDELRAERGRTGEEIMRLQRQLNEARRQAEDMLGRRTAADEGFRKLWHEAATQRNTLVRVARALLDVPADEPNGAEMDDLRAAVELFEGRGSAAGTSTDRLRRELWHVLDRMPAGDDDLVATVKKLVRGEDNRKGPK